MHWDWDAFIAGIVASVVASVAAAVVSVLAVFRPLVSSATKTLEKSLRPVNEIPDIAAFATLVAESLSEFNGDYRRLVMYRALPCELSVQFLRHCFGPHPADEAVHAVNVYQECIARMVKQGEGAHDKTIFGRTGQVQLDAATRHACLSDYFRGDDTVDTSELGLHENFNEIGILLLGETVEQRRDDLKQWKAGFVVVFSQDFKTVRGFRHNVHGHIENLRIVFDERRSDLEKDNMYYSLHSDMRKADVAAFKGKIESFFQNAPSRKRQITSVS
jgi:hypothetical protein